MQKVKGNILLFRGLLLTAVWWIVAATAICYAVRLGHHFTPYGGTTALVWPPAGIALAALIMLGRRAWPAVLAGLFAGYYSVDQPLVFALIASAGGTLAPVLGSWLLLRFAAFNRQLVRLRDVLGLMAIGGLVATTVSAALGALGLVLVGTAPWETYGQTWLNWWLGDVFGVIIFAPLITRWMNTLFEPVRRIHVLEGACLALLLTWANLLIFGEIGVTPQFGYSLVFINIPLLMWAALRLGMHGATISATLTAMVAVICTAGGTGPFSGQNYSTDIAMVWMYIMVVSVSTLILGATVAERRAAFKAMAYGIQAASRTQRSLLPDAIRLGEIEREGGLQVAYRYKASQSMGGDVFGVTMMNGEEVGVFVADISGHGVEASLSAVSLQSFIQATLMRISEPVEVAQSVNRFCFNELPEDVFATMVYLRFSPSRMLIEAVIAGHPPLILWSGTGGFRKIESNMPPMGMFADAVDDLTPVRLQLRKRDKLLIYSDGVTETRNARGQMFTMPNLEKLLLSHRDTPTADVPTWVLAAVQEWQGEQGQSPDDITIVSVGISDLLADRATA